MPNLSGCGGVLSLYLSLIFITFFDNKNKINNV